MTGPEKHSETPQDVGDPSRGRHAAAPSTGTDFFIPDLCTARPLLLMFILAELLVLVYALGSSSLPRFDWNSLALTSLFVQWVVIFSAALLCTSRPLLARVSLPLGVLASFALILTVSLLSSITAMNAFANSSLQTMDAWWLGRNLLVTAVFSGIALRYFFLQQQLREREQAELRARIESLRARIRPHFLFNTMNSIASLIGSRPDEAEQVVEDLSELFRASLEENKDLSSLADELHLCELYLRIEELRLGGRLRVRWSVDETARRCQLPPLLLQPLVENAVYHGVARIAEGGEIAITATRRDDLLTVTVVNPVAESGAPVTGGHHMALDNISERLEAHYGAAAALTMAADNKLYTVTVVLPQPIEAEV